MALGIRTVEQRISAGNDFQGQPPTTEVVRGDNLESYPEDIQGGLFDLDLSQPAFVRSIELKLGGQSFWTVHKRDKDDFEFLLFCGTDEISFLTTESDSFILTAKQKVVIRTTGSTSALMARVYLQSAV